MEDIILRSCSFTRILIDLQTLQNVTRAAFIKSARLQISSYPDYNTKAFWASEHIEISSRTFESWKSQWKSIKLFFQFQCRRRLFIFIFWVQNFTTKNKLKLREIPDNIFIGDYWFTVACHPSAHRAACCPWQPNELGCWCAWSECCARFLQ